MVTDDSRGGSVMDDETKLCDCGKPVHYEGHHYPDTSHPGFTGWCMCGGAGQFHHTSKEATNG